MFWYKNKRDEIQTSNPDLSFGDLAKFAEATWAGLEQKVKAPYEEAARADRKTAKNYQVPLSSERSVARSGLTPAAQAALEAKRAKARLKKKEQRKKRATAKKM
jgi:hypothetical protein